ncbi:glycosyltransferase family 4 protein [Acidaminobacter sp. JC074]|uniref:glycosyltransferase n=1 Tax=Acidaminobacter sp. JC074 TaxID=2530199 RepID=UPI001F0E4117|nr:glycosyltransferase [Acidaminobacter sp. JC074]MCH4891364.1 glycosyltransferase family 4 protein [Acidaminobacter sp. JC074]
MKILITTDCYLPTINGVVTSVLSLYNELKYLGHDVKVLTLKQSKHIELENVYYLKSFGLDKVYPDARMIKSFGRNIINQIIEWSPDIIHSQSEVNTYYIAKKIAKKLSIPQVHTYHTIYEDYAHYIKGRKSFNKLIIRQISKLIMNSNDLVIAPTSKVKDILIDYKVSKPIKVVPTGVDFNNKDVITDNEKRLMRKMYSIPEDHFIMLFLGRLAQEKNVNELIQFVHQMSNKKITLLIVGDGPQRPKLEEIVKIHKLENRIKFTGKVKPDNVHEYYQLADLFISASTSETQGLTYFESLACGTPALCRKDRCLDNVIMDHFNGFQYETFEDFEYYANLVLDNETKKSFMAKNALDYSREFSKEAFAIAMERLYLQVIRGKSIKRFAA